MNEQDAPPEAVPPEPTEQPAPVAPKPEPTEPKPTECEDTCEMMNPREIVAAAWAITNKEKQMRRWGFASSILQTLLNVKLLIYQAWFAYSYFVLKDPIGFFTIEEKLLEYLPFGVFLTIMISFVLLLVVEWLFPHIAKGAIIGLAAKSYRKEEVKGGLVLGMYNFFPIFGAHEMLALSGASLCITICSLILRYGGAAAPAGITIVFSLFLFSVIMEFFWIFAEEAIVIRKRGFKAALGHSFKLVISHLGHVVFLMLLMFIIILRVIANLLMIIIIPGFAVGIGFLLTRFLPAAVSWSIAVTAALVIIGLASYFFAYLEVFRQTVWTLTYLELSKLKELDVIEES